MNKYLTSLSNRTNTGSKLTFKNPSSTKSESSLTSKYWLSFSSVDSSTPYSHYFIFKSSNSRKFLHSDANSFYTSLYSSLSWILCDKHESLSIGSLIRSNRPEVQLRAPAIGGKLLGMGALISIRSTSDLPSKKIACTIFKSCLYSSRRVMCFFSSSSWMMGLWSRPSNESRSLNLPIIVSQTSKP